MSATNIRPAGVQVTATAVGKTQIQTGVSKQGKPWTKLSLQGSFVTADGVGRFVKCQQYIDKTEGAVLFENGETFYAEVEQVDGYEKSRDVLSLFVTFKRPALVDANAKK